MTKDRSLDDFLGSDDAEKASEKAESSEREQDEKTPSDDEPAAVTSEQSVSTNETSVTPAIATFQWSPSGAACASCGETVQRRWYDKEAATFVCVDCKNW
jgi:hypothetical protein